MERAMSPLQIFGYLCFTFAAVDFSGQFLDYDLTGVSWSPIVAGVLGMVLTGMKTADE